MEDLQSDDEEHVETKTALELSVGDKITSDTGTAGVESVRTEGDSNFITWNHDLTIHYLADVFVATREMNPTFALAREGEETIFTVYG